MVLKVSFKTLSTATTIVGKSAGKATHRIEFQDLPEKDKNLLRIAYSGIKYELKSKPAYACWNRFVAFIKRFVWCQVYDVDAHKLLWVRINKNCALKRFLIPERKTLDYTSIIQNEINKKIPKLASSPTPTPAPQPIPSQLITKKVAVSAVVVNPDPVVEPLTHITPKTPAKSAPKLPTTPVTPDGTTKATEATSPVVTEPTSFLVSLRMYYPKNYFYEQVFGKESHNFTGTVKLTQTEFNKLPQEEKVKVEVEHQVHFKSLKITKTEEGKYDEVSILNGPLKGFNGRVNLPHGKDNVTVTVTHHVPKNNLKFPEAANK